MRIQNVSSRFSINNYSYLNANKNSAAVNTANVINSTNRADSINFGMATKAQMLAFKGEINNSSQITPKYTPKEALEMFKQLGVKAEFAKKENPNDEDKIIISNGYKSDPDKLEQYGINEEDLFKHVKEVKGKFIPFLMEHLDIDKVEELHVAPDSSLKTVKVKNCGSAYLLGKKLETFEANSVEDILYVDFDSSLNTVKVNTCGRAKLCGKKLKTFEADSVNGGLSVARMSSLKTVKVNTCGWAYLYGKSLETFEADSVNGELYVDYDSSLKTANVKKVRSINTKNSNPISYPVLEKVEGDFLYTTPPSLIKQNVQIGGRIAQINK